jgi:predicted Rossmann fold flavoprotein
MQSEITSPGSPLSVAVVGGGAAGFFAAISCAEEDPETRVVLFERSAQVLRKVRVSGGGRCNVTHACFDPRELVNRFPRGARELLGPFHTWQPEDTIAWFAARGVSLKTEADGRMFPTTDSSATVIDCLVATAAARGVEVRTHSPVRSVSLRPGGGFALKVGDGERFEADRLIVASGGGARSGGLDLASSLGHTITELAPSLFTFHIDDARIRGLQGLTVPEVRIAYREMGLEQSGPMLITHWGLSGPAILKLSAWGARPFARADYDFELVVSWVGGDSPDSVRSVLEGLKRDRPRKSVQTLCPFDLPRRIWVRLTEAAGVSTSLQWAQISKARLHALVEQLTNGRFHVTGKSMNKEEFVTCGGVSLREIDFRRMESKLVPGLYFAGEVLDIDGVTGGFNFQAAWTTGRIAGISAARAGGSSGGSGTR